MAKMAKKAVETQASKISSSKADRIALADLEGVPGPVTNVREVTEVKSKAHTSKAPSKNEAKPSGATSTPLSFEQGQAVMRAFGAKLVTDAQVDGSLSIGCPKNETLDRALQYGAQGLVDEFAPSDAVESTLAAVIVGTRNAVMTSFNVATKNSFTREIELKIALKGAGVLAELLRVFDAHRGHGNRRVTVGQVNVETGAQAIVGNVETTSHELGTEPTVEVKKPKPRDT
jgi:hypothetical protein